jgi:cell division protein ZapA
MQTHSLSVLGQDVSFKTDADPQRIERARSLLETRYTKLTQHGGHLSKEKLLTFLALALADDFLIMQDEKGEMQSKISQLLAKIEKETEEFRL